MQAWGLFENWNKNFGVESAIFITTCFSKSTFHNKVYTAQEALYNFLFKSFAKSNSCCFSNTFHLLDDPAKYICFHKTSLCDPIF